LEKFGQIAIFEEAANVAALKDLMKE